MSLDSIIAIRKALKEAEATMITIDTTDRPPRLDAALRALRNHLAQTLAITFRLEERWAKFEADLNFAEEP